ncbi:GntR family transcriptional regulator [Streptomyces sp. NPDC048442]|uniref:GntR family transcriptional regulator n=1 Tax=Streptomyces sp. NPDC048442 TaxID=3154823 RepID=UPI003431CB0C
MNTPTSCQTVVGRATGVLREQIASGVYQPDSPLPLLQSLASRLGVGSQALHQALGRLAAEGVVERSSTARPTVRAEPAEPTPVAQVAQLLRERVAGGTYVPGQAISPAALAAELGVSCPVAEAGCAWSRQEGYLRDLMLHSPSRQELVVCEPSAYTLPATVP